MIRLLYNIYYSIEEIIMSKVTVAVNKAIRSTGVAKLRIHDALVEIGVHAYNTGDYTEFTRLVEGVSGVNTQAIVLWGQRYLGLTFNGQGVTGWSGKNAIKLNDSSTEKGGKSVKWWTLKPMNAYAGFDLNARLEKLIADADRATQKAANDDEAAKLVSVNSDMLRALTVVRDHFLPKEDVQAA